MNIAQRRQAEIKAKLAAGEAVKIPAPNYGKQHQQVGGNPAAKFRLNKLAEQEATRQQQQASQESAQTYDIVKAALQGDINTLKNQKTIKEKLEYKAHILPQYLDYLQQYAQSGHNHPNEVLSQTVVWLFDCQQFDMAFVYANLAMQQKQKLPARFNTPNFETFICDSLADYSVAQRKAKQPAPALQFAIDGVQSGWDVHDIVKGKVLAEAAKNAEAESNWQQAFDYANAALEANDKAGVKGLLKNATAQLAAQAEAQQPSKGE
ncbi:phage terminase small subunit [Bowmanella denitrificans]|uniref:phage terminase small subunit n=1 Tax=Bowmanella denitrificans TaxID=366582 RepID=UPI000C9B6D42|nr:phage terminase small subunit [Bowmanella denitrificans]